MFPALPGLGRGGSLWVPGSEQHKRAGGVGGDPGTSSHVFNECKLVGGGDMRGGVCEGARVW